MDRSWAETASPDRRIKVPEPAQLRLWAGLAAQPDRRYKLCGVLVAGVAF